MKRILLGIIPLLVGCSDFNLGYTPGGDPRPIVYVHDTLVDTLIVPSDSVIVYGRYAFKDTVLNESVSVRSGNYLELRIQPEWNSDVDSLNGFGIAVSSDSLAIRFSQGGSVFTLPQEIVYKSAGGLDRYEVLQSLNANQPYRIRWTNPTVRDAEVDLQFLHGYSSQDSSVKPSTTFDLVECRDIALRARKVVFGNAYAWEKFAVLEGDSLWGNMQLEDGLQAYILSSSDMETLLNTGAVGAGLWSSLQGDESFELTIEQADTLFYLLENPSSDDLEISDTLQLIRILAP